MNELEKMARELREILERFDEINLRMSNPAVREAWTDYQVALQQARKKG